MKKLLMMIAILSTTMYGQVSANLTIENQQAVPPDFSFDLYLTSTGTNDLYLGTADFVMTFNVGNFLSPVLSKEGSSPGYCTFVPTDQTFPYPLFTKMNYFNNTSVEILNGNQLVINLNGPTPTDITGFNQTVAWIDDSPITHRLGKFKVSGINNPDAYMNLQWVTASTLVYSINPTTFNYELITFNAINPVNAPLPVELSNFTAKASNDQVQLNWETKTEVNNFGFEVERISNANNENKNWQKIGFVEGNGNSNSPKQYSFIDNDLQSGNYSYRLKQIDTDGQFDYSAEVNVVVEVPTDYVLAQNFPNPFNPSTTIKFSIPEAGMVKLTVYNLLGQEVKTLVEEQRQAGSYTELFNASGLNSGVYFYELRVNGFILNKENAVIKIKDKTILLSIEKISITYFRFNIRL